jgi:hypothetical protein
MRSPEETLEELLRLVVRERDSARLRELIRLTCEQITEIRARHKSKVPRVPAGPQHEAETFDLFSGAPDGRPAWLEAIKGLEPAKARIQEIATKSPGEYFIFHAHSREIVLRLDTGPKKWGGSDQSKTGAA